MGIEQEARALQLRLSSKYDFGPEEDIGVASNQGSPEKRLELVRSELRPQLFDYQADLAESATNLLIEGKRGLLALPTGAGKTRTAVVSCFQFVAEKKTGVVWLSPTRELVNQAFETAATLWNQFGILESLDLFQGSVPAFRPGKPAIWFTTPQAIWANRLSLGGGHQWEAIVFDEAHQLEDTLTATVGVTISASRATTLATAMNKVVEDDKLLTELFDAAALLRTLFSPHIETRLSLPLPVDIVDQLNALRITVNSCLDALRKIDSTLETVRQKVLRAQTLASRFADDLDAVLRVSSTSVPFVSGTTERPELVIAPLDVGPILAEFVWPLHTAIMTSATIPLSMPERIGLSPDKVHVLDVGSPFNYEEQGRLYCATHLPDPNAQRDDAVHDELATLITAAGGRTLALFTSRRALTSAVEEMRKRLPFRILAQDENQKPSLLRDFLLDETSCLFATAGFFEGVDIPGRALSLVVIDRIPFPHRNNPLLAARRDLHGAKGFTEIDLPRAITALAQATGRLIRTRTDKGVVAVLDPRLASKSYRWSIINALPPLKRIKDINEATAFLKEITQ